MAIQPAEAGPSTPPQGRQPQYKLAHSLSGHTRAVTALGFSPDGRFLVSAGADGLVQIWNAGTGEHERTIRGHKTGINDLSISPDGLYIATASDDKCIHVHSMNAPRKATSRIPSLRRFQGHTAPVLCTAFSPKSDCLVSGSFDESAILWDVRTGNILRVLPAHSEAVWTVGWDREAGMILTGSADGCMRIWDAHTGQCLKTLENETNSPVSYASFTPSSTYILSSTLASTIRLYDIHSSKVLKTLRAPTIFTSERFPSPALLYTALPESEGMEIDGAEKPKKKPEAWVVSGSENGKVVIWELSSRRVAQVLGEGGHKVSVVALAVSSDGRTIASGSLEPERIIHLWRDES